MTANPVVLILGAGSNIGASVATKFSSNGYKVALVSRSGTGSKTAEGYLSLKADLTQPDAIPPVFEAVKAEFNVAPIVVVYNAYSMEFIPKDGSIFSISAEKFQSDLVVNSVTSYVAAQQAVTAWKSLPEETQKTFIYTGNYLDTTVASVPDWLNLGVGKGASAYWVGLADILHAEKGIRQVFQHYAQTNGF